MAIYKMVGDKERLVEIDSTSFGQEGMLERADLQRILRDQPEVLEEGLLIISEEFGNWQDSNRRIDLLGLDAEGRLVVVELKRGDTGGHMDLQAIRYAAMVANMTYQQVVDTYQSYLEKRANEPSGTPVDEDAAETRLREHFPSNEQDDAAIHTQIPRMILASENFGKELTTCVMWLNDSWLREAGQEMKCVRLQPHRNGDEVLIEASVVIPLPEASDYQTRLGKRERETRSESSEKSQNVPGAGDFRESICRASEQHQPGLRRLYEAAIAMEEEEIVELSTLIRSKDRYYRIDLWVPGTRQKFVSFNNILRSGTSGAERGGEISFWRTEPASTLKSLSKFDELIGKVTSQSGQRHRRLSGDYDWEAIMDAIRNAYREASGLRVKASSPDG